MSDEPVRGAGATGASPVVPSDGRPLSRRDRTRLATVEEIKDAARHLLSTEGDGADLSLRAVAREVGMTPSAIYRYFESRQDLLDALALDAFASVSGALQEAVDAHAGTEWFERSVAVCHAYRTWCLEHDAEFTLIFRTDRPATTASVSWREHLLRFYSIPFALLAQDVANGDVVVADETEPAQVQPELLALGIESVPEGVNGHHVDALTSIWAAVHGHVCLELFGHIGLVMVDETQAFDRHVRRVLGAVAARG